MGQALEMFEKLTLFVVHSATTPRSCVRPYKGASKTGIADPLCFLQALALWGDFF